MAMVSTREAEANRIPRVTFVWHGLPMYAARLLRGAIATGCAEVAVVATRPSFPVDGIESIVDAPMHWARVDQRLGWADLELAAPDIVVASGWSFPLCDSLVREAVARGSRAVLMSDNRWRADLRQQVGRLVYRLMYRRLFSAAWVSGQSAATTLLRLGADPTRIYRKLYGCDPDLFASATPLADRGRTIVFVGQMIARKGVDVLVEGFVRSRLADQGWTLQMFGSGPLAGIARGKPGVIHREFSPPEVVSDAVKQARIFALPSRDDNWPIALHEGASAGCQLVTTRAVGSHEELITADNGVVVMPGNAPAIAEALGRLAAASPAALRAAEAASLRLAAGYGPRPFGEEFRRLCRDLG